MKRIILVAAVMMSCFACVPKIPHTVKEPMQSSDLNPAPGKAIVVFVRSSSNVADVSFALHDDEKIIGVVNGENCSIYSASPGMHIFDSFVYAGRNRYTFIEADLAADRTYYILVEPYTIPDAGIFSDLRPILNGSEYWSNLSGWLAQCNITEVNDETIAWDRRVSKKNTKSRERDFEDWKKKTAGTKKAIKPEDGVNFLISPAW